MSAHADAALGAVAVAGAIHAGSNMIDKMKARIRRVRNATIGLFLTGIILALIGIVLLVYFVKDWDTKKWVSIIGIVLLVLGILCLLAGSLCVYIIVRIYRSIEDHGSMPTNTEDVSKVPYPRQKDYPSQLPQPYTPNSQEELTRY